MLVTEGLLERVPGRGTFVAHPRRRVGRLSSYTEDMKLRGLLPESQTPVARREQAGPGVARALDISAGDAVIHWKRLRRADQHIVCVEDAYLNEVLLPGFLQSGMPTSLYDALEERGLRPTWAEDAISADAATVDEATLLEIQPGAPVLHLSRRALCGDKVVNVSRTAFRPDRFTMYVQLGDWPEGLAPPPSFPLAVSEPHFSRETWVGHLDCACPARLAGAAVPGPQNLPQKCGSLTAG
ncbi:GntR family transcriptional regulator [Nocardioides sp. B-3]|uniref:GntR family transcriptional regulator n=1 Tax=Nocardioides sp. B-3 TaxID=2895565 RepID=UPI0021535997|nr:GntR family transcriptional regulator [Nocardioides sp. B-3]UUZ57792.1 GntR family transcriptional regulator [Nocardioides sp. B-3]